jgi:hypothetical protein
MNSNDLSHSYAKPVNVSEEEWYAIDLNDPLMMVC